VGVGKLCVGGWLWVAGAKWVAKANEERQTFDVAICNSSRKRSEQIFFWLLSPPFFRFSISFFPSVCVCVNERQLECVCVSKFGAENSCEGILFPGLSVAPDK